MDKILSQDEINALFSTMSTGGEVLENAANQAPAAERSATQYDFCRSDRIAKEQIRAIHALHTHFARSLSSSLSAYLRALVEVSLISVDQISYAEFLKLLADPTLFCSISMQPMHGHMAMELSPPLVFPIIDMLLGGMGNAPLQNRTLTEIELQVVGGVIKLALHDMKEAWRSILEVNPQLESAETKPQMLQIVAPGEAVVAIGFEIKVGDNSGMLNLCIPSMMLKMNRLLFDQQRRHRQPEAGASQAGKISGMLRSARVKVTTEIRDKNFVVEDLLRMGVGDIIQLNYAIGDPIQLSVGGVTKFCGHIMVRRGRRSFQISDKYIA